LVIPRSSIWQFAAVVPDMGSLLGKQRCGGQAAEQLFLSTAVKMASWVVHRLTPAGREELARWPNRPSPRTRGYRDDFFLKVIAAVPTGDPGTMARVIGHQRTYLVRELHSLHEARTVAGLSAVDGLLITAAELHIRADLGIAGAIEQTLDPGAVTGLRDSTPAAAGWPQSTSGIREGSGYGA
jgi:hypothetical protein